MKPIVNKMNKYIEVIGHYDDKVLCAKLTLLADLYAIEHKEGYAKFKIEDEDKLNLINGELDYLEEPSLDVTITVNGTIINGVYEGNTLLLRNDGLYNSSENELVWTASPSSGQTFLGLSRTEGATTPDSGLAVGDSFTAYRYSLESNDFYSIYGTSVPSLNDLTNTTWVINSSPTLSPLSSGQYFTINYTTNQRACNYIGIGQRIPGDEAPLPPGANFYLIYYSNDATVYDDSSDRWTLEVYRTIEITGGTDVTNSNLISWLEANATLLNASPLKTSFSKISYDATNKILTIDDKYYQLASTATGSNITGTSFSSMSLDELGELIIDNTSIHLPIKTTQISFDNGGTYTCANGVTFTMSAFDYLDDHNPELANYQGYWFTNSLGRNMLIWVIEEDNQPYVWETANNWLGDTDNVAQTWHTTYTSYADDMYVHIVDDDYDYMSVASQLGWSEADLPEMWQDAEEKFDGIDYVFLHFKRNRTTGYWEIQEES